MKITLFPSFYCFFPLSNGLTKKIFLVFVITSSSFGQTNVFPTTGNVGIGITTPGAKLHVIGSGIFSSGINFGGIEPVGDSNWYPKINNYGTDLNFYSVGRFKFNVSHDDDSNYHSGMTINRWGTVYIGENTLQDDGNPTYEKLKVDGVIKSYVPDHLGTSLNNFQLLNEIAGAVISNNMFNRLWSLRDVSGGNNWYSARLHDGISIDASFGTPHVDTRTWWERDPEDNIQSWGNAGDTYMTINNGNVGIGSINPDAKLTVNGTIHSTEVKVTQTVPADYVFEKYYTGKSELKSDYVMPTLAEIENFTMKNNHLPNVPSAKEMQQNGVLLGEMSNILLQKIEELTLYVIEQNKKIEELETKLNKISNQNLNNKF